MKTTMIRLFALSLLFALAGCDDAAIGNAPADYAQADILLPHVEFTLESRVMQETRRMNIYLPPGYAESKTSRYPILYMPDGGSREDFPHLTHTVDSAIRDGLIRPIIVVGIENTRRRRDMTGPTDVAGDKKIAPVVGGSASFRAFISEELMPEVQRRVRGNGETAIIGESLAGLFIVESFFLQPAMFDFYIAIDPSLWWNNNELATKSAQRLRAGSGEDTTLYLTTASERNNSNIEFITPLVASLRQYAPENVRWFYEPMPSESHATIYRAAKLPILKLLYAPQDASK